MESKVSVIVPIYNVEKYLKECVDSILKQSYKNIEVLLIDDCGTDNSGEIAKNYEKQDKRCIYIRREKNGGLSAARNTGIKNATGEYLSFIDSDDWVDKDFIRNMLEGIVNDDAEIAICDYWMVDDRKKNKGNSLVQIDNNSSQKEKIAYIRNHAWTKMFRKDFWDKCGLMFPEDIKRGEDMGITIPLLTFAKKISIINEPLYYYRQRNNSLSNQKENERIDLSFYDKTFQNMIKNANNGYKEEIEYHAIMEMIYGKTMLMIKHNYSAKEIRAHLQQFDIEFENWRKNKYISKTNKLKKLFIKLAGFKLIFLLKEMVIINETRKK